MMRFVNITFVITLASLASSASAYINQNLLIARASLDVVPVPTDRLPNAQCLADLQSLGQSVPTPPPQLQSFLHSYASAAHTNQVNVPCGWIAAVPDSLSPLLSVYETSVLAWATHHAALLTAIQHDCPSNSAHVVCSSTPAAVVVVPVPSSSFYSASPAVVVTATTALTVPTTRATSSASAPIIIGTTLSLTPLTTSATVALSPTSVATAITTTTTAASSSANSAAGPSSGLVYLGCAAGTIVTGFLAALAFL